MKKRGIPVIAITSLEQSQGSSPRHGSGTRLFEVADVAIDNCVPPGDALVRIDGTGSMTGASSTVAGSAIIHSIVIEALSELAGRGEFIIVPLGVEHRPVAEEQVPVLLFEPAGTLNTGNVQGERTVAEPARL